VGSDEGLRVRALKVRPVSASPMARMSPNRAQEERANQQHMGGPMRRIVGLALAIGALAIPATAFADPDFGPGNSSKGPNDGGAKCHPPGQTVNEPGCK
jgi:hypothetical protein